MRSVHASVLAAVILFGTVATVALRPVSTDAAGNMADLQCLPNWNYNCPCGVACQKPKDPRPGGKGCPCVDVTNGFSTPGTCVSAIKCQASSPEGMPPMLPMPPMPMPMPMPMPDQDPCASGAGAGSGASAGTSTSAASSTCPDYSGGFNSFPSYDTSVFDTNTSGTSDTSGVSNLISSLLNGNVSSDTSAGTATQTNGSVVPGASAAPATPKAPFGSAEGVTGDVQIQGVFARVLASNRNTARGTQVSGFYGFQTADGVPVTTVFKNLCALRPWSTNFISFIVPSSYFDALCTARNFVVGVTAAPASGSTGTTGTVPTTSTKPKIGAVDAATGVNYNTQPVSGSIVPAAPKEYLGKARVDIWATPPSVSKGERTSIFWDSAGVYTCSISSSDRAFNGSSLSGHASTQTLSQNTTFSIACQTATSTVSNQVVVTVK